GLLHIRVSGSGPAVSSAVQKIGGQRMPDDDARAHWNSLRDQTHPFFAARPLWRVAVPPVTPPLDLGPTLIEWNGGLRWIAQPQADAGIRATVTRHGGHATLYRYSSKPADLPIFQPLEPALKNINQRLKQELDPVGI